MRVVSIKDYRAEQRVQLIEKIIEGINKDKEECKIILYRLNEFEKMLKELLKDEEKDIL